MIKDSITTKFKGRLRVYNADTGEILLDKYNAIHVPNMATSIANNLNNAAASISTFRVGDGVGAADVTTPSAGLISEVYSASIIGTFVITSPTTASRQLEVTTTLGYTDANGTAGLTEIGLFDNTGIKLTHITFAPISKDSSIELRFVYDITMTIS